MVYLTHLVAGVCTSNSGIGTDPAFHWCTVVRRCPYLITILGFYWLREMGIVLGVVLEEGSTCDAPALLPAGVRCAGFVPAVSTWVLYGLNPGIFFFYLVVLWTISFVLAFVLITPLSK